MHTPTQVGPGVVYQSFEAGHIFGSTTMLLELESGGKKVRLGFTGDLGRPGLPIIRDPEPLPPADYLIMESTYGNRVHEPIQSVAAKLAEIVNRTYRRGGKIIVPAFAVGRTQQLVLLLHELIQANAIPEVSDFRRQSAGRECHRSFPQAPRTIRRGGEGRFWPTTAILSDFNCSPMCGTWSNPKP
jgi:metallo-beta-lactamase family protein